MNNFKKKILKVKSMTLANGEKSSFFCHFPFFQIPTEQLTYCIAVAAKRSVAYVF
jgi:hypothetical protein